MWQAYQRPLTFLTLLLWFLKEKALILLVSPQRLKCHPLSTYRHHLVPWLVLAKVTLCLLLNYSALRKYPAPLNFATFCHISGFKHKGIKLYFLWRINNKWDTIMKWNNIYWIFQTFLTNQKLKNWAGKIIQPLYFQCSKLSPEVQWGSLNDPMLT